MAIYAKAGGNFKPAPEGQFAATCCDVIDHGMQPVTYLGKTRLQHKISIAWQIGVAMDNGKPYLIRRRYTCSLHEKSSLRRDLESWRGKAFSGPELEQFDLESLLSVPCLLNIIHNDSLSGGTFANVNSILRLPKTMAAPQIRDYVRVKDRPPAQTDQANDNESGLEITDDDIPF
jgi:hypothetical protein